jgi:hypothetical protein
VSHPAQQPESNNRPRRFTPALRTHRLVFLAFLSALVLLSVVAGSRYRSRQSATNARSVSTAQVARPAATRAEAEPKAAEPALSLPNVVAASKPTSDHIRRPVVPRRERVEEAGTGRAENERDGDGGAIREEGAVTLSNESAEGLERAAPMPKRSAVPTSGTNNSKARGVADRDAAPKGSPKQDEPPVQASVRGERGISKPREEHLTRAHEFNGDLRKLPFRRPVRRERPEREGPEPHPTVLPGTSGTTAAPESAAPNAQAVPSAPAPATTANFDGLDFANWGAGHPPDTNGDVGPTYYIQTVNTSIGIFRKSDGNRVAAFTFDTFMSQGHFGNLCDTDNFGDPVVLYDSFEDRWVITDFAFKLDGSGNVINPPGSFQCFAVSKTGDPVSGGWNYYSINTAGGLGDYPKFGIWPDGLYMSANMFGYPNGAAFQNPRVYALNKAQMYAGSPTVQVVSFDAPSAEFTLLPSNARLQTGTPPAGSPNYFAVVAQFLNSESVYKFHVDWDRISLSTFTGPSNSTMTFWWEQFSRSSTTTAPSPANFLDTLYPRLMMQNQYTNIGGVESLWTSHTVGAGNPTTNLTSSQSAIRYYQLNVTGGTVAANMTQDFTYSPDATLYRYMPSLAVDRAGNMAIGYTTSNATTNPALQYAGRLAADPVNSITQTEQLMFQGTGSQSGNCGSGSCIRWGDYSAMSLDPDGCTFWYTNEYYAANGLNDLTRIGAFSFPQCTPVGAGGTVQGTVTDGSSNPISGATVALGSRTTTTNAGGGYSFTNIPAGTYPVITASFAGFGSSTVTNVVVADAGTTLEDFTLSAAPVGACFVDTSQADFQTGVGTNADMTTSPGDVKLLDAPGIDQQNQSVSPTGFAFTNTSWAGQTFTAGASGKLVRADVELFCSGCSGTNPNITVSIRATSGTTPTGADLATATLAGFNDGGAGGLKTVTFNTPLQLTAGTKYAIIFRSTATRTGSYAYTCSCATTGFSNTNPYANGQRVTSTNSGSTWTADTTVGGRDLHFAVYVDSGFPASGNLVSGTKDSNPAANSAPTWSNLSWTATTPANTSVKFQAAASNNAGGPFSFVGPDGTANTFFASGDSLSRFNGNRYLKYEALLGTTDSTTTPVVNDVTVCFSNIVPTISAAASLSRQQGSASANAQIASVGDTTQSAGTLNVSAAPKTGSGVTVGNVSVDSSGNVTADVSANCSATNSTFTLTVTDNLGAKAFATLTVNVTANDAPTLSYASPQSVNFADSLNVTPASSGDNGTVIYQVMPGDGLTTPPTVDPATGVVSVTNAQPSGPHTVTIRATDNCGAQTDAGFILNVANPDLRANDASAAEPKSGTSPMLFTVTLSLPSPGGVSVNYATADDTPGAGHATGGSTCDGTADYQSASGTLTFAAGEQVKTVTVNVCADNVSGETNETFLLNLSNPSNANAARAVATGTITQANQAGALLISELRTSGPSGPGDQFVELYNNTDTPLTVTAADASGGYGLFKMGATCTDTPVLVAQIPNGTVIPARGHYLLVGSQYSLANYGGTGAAAGDQTLTSDIESDRNVAIFTTSDVTNLSTAARLDAVGFGSNVNSSPVVAAASKSTLLASKNARKALVSSPGSLASGISGGVCDLLREGSTLPPVSGTTADHSFFRKECDFQAGVGCTVQGTPKDTNDNSSDFEFADTQGTNISGVPRQLGAPGPENKTSPIRRDSTILVSLLDNTVSSAAIPNRVRDVNATGTNAAFGTLSIRRRVTNQTGANVTRLRFRIVEVTTFPSPGAGVAELRALSSADVSGGVMVNDPGTCSPSSAPCTVVVRGTSLEQPPTQSGGGGVNSTLAVGVVSLAQPLAPNAAVNVQFLLGVQQTGTFRFLVITEALP